MASISLKGVSKVYSGKGTGGGRPGFNLEIGGRELVVLVGPSDAANLRRCV
mgnify:CR=1 FL=1